MQTALNYALAYAEQGWYVFPIAPYTKVPYKDFKWKKLSTNSPETIRATGESKKYKNCNWAIDCGKSNVFILDIDKRPDKDGAKTLRKLCVKLPDTLLHVETPSGGLHYYFAGPGPSTESKLGPGLDTRGVGGYALIPGSVNGNNNPYKLRTPYPFPSPAPIPTWAKDILAQHDQTKDPKRDIPITDSDQPQNVTRAIDYLKNQAPTATEGQAGDHTTYAVACRLRDYALSDTKALELLSTHWNDTKAFPPWTYSDLERKVKSAYAYAKDRPGNATPEALFPTQLSTPSIRCAAEIQPDKIPPREWILGNRYLAGYVTVTIAPGGVGKSLFTILEGLSIAANQQLTYDEVKLPGAVWLYNAEDPFDELERRVAAAAIHYSIPLEQGLNRFFYSSGYQSPFVLAAYDQKNRPVVNKKLIDSIIEQIKARKVTLFIVDPFVACHAMHENDNEGINVVMQAFRRIAAETGCAISLVHHSNKGEKDARGNMDKSRGASSLVFAARIAHTLYPMTPKESLAYGVSPKDVSSYVRLDSAKANLSLQSNESRWYQKTPTRINDGNPETTGVFTKADSLIECLSASLDAEDALIIDEVIKRVTFAVEMVGVHTLAQQLAGLESIKKSYKTVQNRIENLFIVPICEGGYTWRLSTGAAANWNKMASNVILCTCDVMS